MKLKRRKNFDLFLAKYIELRNLRLLSSIRSTELGIVIFVIDDLSSFKNSMQTLNQS